MILKKMQDVHWLEFELFQNCPRLIHGTFLRHGGVSQHAWTSLNAGGGSSDNPHHVTENRKRMLKALNISSYFSAFQVHGDHIAHVQHPDQKISECDAMLTKLTQHALMIKHADCQAAIFYDAIQHALATVHCGWRGNVKNIYAKTVGEMISTFGTKPENLLVAISPSLGPSHAQFIHYKTELPIEFWKFETHDLHFNFWEIAYHQLLHSGILSHHIQIARICTFENANDYFSYRRDKVTGRHATFAMLACTQSDSKF